MEEIIVNISKKHDVGNTKSYLIRCLTDLLNETIDADEKVKLLKEEYGIPTTTRFEEEVFTMTAICSKINNGR